MPDEQTQIPFITDDEAARELRRVANGLRDLTARLPSLARTLDDIADKLWPDKTHPQAERRNG